MPKRNTTLASAASTRPVRKPLAALSWLDARVVWAVGLACYVWLVLCRFGGRVIAPRVRVAGASLARQAARALAWAAPWVARIARCVPWSCVLGAAAVAVVAVCIPLWRSGGNVLGDLIGLTGPDAAYLGRKEVVAVLAPAVTLGYVVTGIATLAALLAFVRARLSFWFLRGAGIAFTASAVFVLVTVWRLATVLRSVDAARFPRDVQSHLALGGALAVLPFGLYAVVYLLCTGLRSVATFYGRAGVAEPLFGDRVWINLRTGGPDPQFRKGMYESAFLHFFVLVVLPALLAVRGCQRPYAVPKGSGTQVIQTMRVYNQKAASRPRTVKKIDSAVVTDAPTIEESDVFEEMDKITEQQYEASKEDGKLGAGGGKEGGWPNGMEKARVRFIRLEYDGGDWDLDMGYGSDYNVLIKFRELTGFAIWPKTESIRIADLTHFPRKRAPPFVFVTGGLKGRMSISQSEAKTLRKYCLDMAGMIFASNGGGNFDTGFRALLQRAFPDLPVVDIPSDDVIYRQPYVFPNGAPPLWHHSGNRAVGVKYNGRWVVFYHQGDLGDAWKDGHSGADAGLVAQAYKLGVNVIAYAFSQYMQENYGDK